MSAATQISVPMDGGEIELTTEQRMVWGKCPVCGARPGEWCLAQLGWQLAADRKLETGEGAHLARLHKAPFKIQVTEVSQ